MSLDYKVIREFSFGGFDTPEIELTAELIKNQNCVFFGGSKSGKTRALLYCAYLLKDEIPVAVVFSPTDVSTGNYDGIFPKVFIHTKFDMDVLRKMYDNQKEMMAAHTMSNNIKMLEKLYEYVHSSEIDRNLADLKDKRKVSENQIRSYYHNQQDHLQSQLERLNYEFKKIHLKYMRSVIKNEAPRLIAKHDLDDKERLTLSGCLMNPHRLIILDDCASQFKTLSSEQKKLLREIYFEGRNYGLTTFVSTQYEKSLEKELRENIHVCIYTNTAALTSSLDGSQGSWSKTCKKRGQALIPAWQSGQLVRDNMTTMVVIFRQCSEETVVVNYAERREFKFGCDAYWEFGEKACASVNEAINKDNKYISRLLRLNKH